MHCRRVYYWEHITKAYCYKGILQDYHNPYLVSIEIVVMVEKKFRKMYVTNVAHINYCSFSISFRFFKENKHL